MADGVAKILVGVAGVAGGVASATPLATPATPKETSIIGTPHMFFRILTSTSIADKKKNEIRSTLGEQEKERWNGAGSNSRLRYTFTSISTTH